MTEISRAESPQDIALVRALWIEYWEALGLALSFQNFGEQLNSLPGEFTPPKGLLLLALHDSQPAGTIAVRPLREDTCEVKRLYVPARFRGHGLGEKLLLAAIENARQASYKTMFGDTLPTMNEAVRLYDRLGFERTTAYSPNPTPGAIYLRLGLQNGTP